MARKTTRDTDAKTLELIEQIKRQQAEIAHAEKPNWLTNRNFAFEEGSSKILVLHVETDVRKLIGVVAFLLDQERSYTEAARSLGVDNPPAFQWQGHSVTDWSQDVRLRIDKLQIAAKKSKLEALEARLNAIISPELRRQLELEAIQAAMD